MTKADVNIQVYAASEKKFYLNKILLSFWKIYRVFHEKYKYILIIWHRIIQKKVSLIATFIKK